MADLTRRVHELAMDRKISEHQVERLLSDENTTRGADFQLGRINQVANELQELLNDYIESCPTMCLDCAGFLLIAYAPQKTDQWSIHRPVVGVVSAFAHGQNLAIFGIALTVPAAISRVLGGEPKTRLNDVLIPAATRLAVAMGCIAILAEPLERQKRLLTTFYDFHNLQTSPIQQRPTHYPALELGGPCYRARGSGEDLVFKLI
jgi:hypothetical protein